MMTLPIAVGVVLIVVFIFFLWNENRSKVIYREIIREEREETKNLLIAVEGWKKQSRDAKEGWNSTIQDLQDEKKDHAATQEVVDTQRDRILELEGETREQEGKIKELNSTQSEMIKESRSRDRRTAELVEVIAQRDQKIKTLDGAHEGRDKVQQEEIESLVERLGQSGKRMKELEEELDKRTKVFGDLVATMRMAQEMMESELLEWEHKVKFEEQSDDRECEDIAVSEKENSK